MVHRSRNSGVCLLLFCGMFLPGRAAAQAWFQTGTGLGAEKPRVAVADFAPRADADKLHRIRNSSPRCFATTCNSAA